MQGSNVTTVLMKVKQRIRLSGLAIRGEEVLLVEQVSPRTGLKRWSSPGGGLELSDSDIFRGVEREMLEETGLQVRAGEVRFINEFFDLTNQTLMIDVWIECHPAEGDAHGEISMELNREDDYISDVRWWSREAFLGAGHRANAPLFKPEFWDNLHQHPGTVIYLGRWEE